LLKAGMVFQFGVPPNRIDLINRIENVHFKEAWENKLAGDFICENKKAVIYYIGIRELIKNKSAVKRYKDKDDLRFLKKLIEKKK